MRVTVFAPHPDDELIGCGGSLRHWTLAGAEVSIVYLTSGDLPTCGMSRADNAALRREEATAGARALGIEQLVFLGEPDGALVESPELIDKLVAQIRRLRPHIAYLPHALDAHPDHMAAHRVVQRALGHAVETWWHDASSEPWRVETTLAYEVWTPLSQPNYVEDTTDVIDEQLAALARHRSQLDHVAYDDFVRGLGSYRGARLGHGRYAEAFEVLSIRNLPAVGAP